MAYKIMQSKIRGKVRYYPEGKDIFEYWAGLGRATSLDKVKSHFFQNGFKNPKTGKPPTRMGLWCAMWRWALLNVEEARRIYAQYVLELDGETLSDDEWYSLVHSRALQLLTSRGYKKFVLDHPELNKFA